MEKNKRQELRHSYSDNTHNKRILIIGLTPPPLGGVSVHLERVGKKFKRQGNVVRHFYSEPRYRYRFIFIYLTHLAWVMFRFKPDQVYVNTLFLPNGLQELRCIVWLKGFLAFDITLVEHNGRSPYQVSAHWKERFRSMMHALHKVVFMGTLTADGFAANGIMPACKTSVEAAFLPPDVGKEAAILRTYPQGLFTFLATHKKVILCNGSALRFWQGKDLYGFDQCIDAFISVAQDVQDCALVLVLSKVEQHAYLVQLQAKIKQRNLNDHVFWLIGQHELWPLMKKIDIFVRPTLSDGHSISLLEAEHFGALTIASDVSERTQKTHLYKTGDSLDLARVLLDCLQSKQSMKYFKRNILRHAHIFAKASMRRQDK